VKVGDFVSIDVYRPASPVFMTTYKGFITEEKLSILRDGPSVFTVLTTTGEIFGNIERSSIRVLRSS
jgi:hypothetical protein